MSVFVYDRKLSYYPVPKIACTSLKKVFFYIQNDVNPNDLITNGKKLNIHRVYTSVAFAQSAPQDREDHFRVTVVRDPVARLLSCYSNRVVHHQELSAPRFKKAALHEGLRPDPTLSEFVDNLEGYRKHFGTITHHSDPMTAYLGEDPAWFSRIFGIHQMEDLRQTLEERTGKSLVIGRDQTGGPKFSRDDLTPRQIARIEEFYARDYELFGRYL
ncbi:MAG: sulfotransferase family 2 domain-containing protein [Paracoccaceae bacterium]